MKSMEQEAIEELQGYIDRMDTVTVRAAQTAIVALREKQEREKGCEYCTNPEEVTGTQPTSVGTHEYFKLKSGFRLEHHYGREWVLRCEHCDSMLLFATHCPRCGRKLVP